MAKTIGLALIGCGLLSGCVAKDGPADGVVMSLAASTQPYEHDIPLPEGFRLVDHGSEDWSSGSFRYIRHQYAGQSDAYAVRRFYREQMPLVRWTPISERNNAGCHVLQFTRGGEACTVTVQRVSALGAGSVQVEVFIAPIERETEKTRQ